MLAEYAAYTAVILFEIVCLIRHDGNKRKEKTISLEEKQNILWDFYKHAGIHISLVKQPDYHNQL
jgi:hypothetical protein